MNHPNRLVKRDGVIPSENTSTGWNSEKNKTRKSNSNRKIIPGNRTNNNTTRKVVNTLSKITEDLNLEKVTTVDGKSRLRLQNTNPIPIPVKRKTVTHNPNPIPRKTISRMQPQPLKQVRKVITVKPKMVRPKEFDEMKTDIVTKMIAIDKKNKIFKSTDDKRYVFYYNANSGIEIIKDVCKHKYWEILNGILIQPKYWGKFGSEFLQWDDLVPTLLENISKDNSKFLFSPILTFINTKYINCKNEKDLGNVLDDIDRYLETAVTSDKVVEVQLISHLKHINFFNKENEEEELYTKDLVNKQLNNIFNSIIRLNKTNPILFYFMSVIYKIIKFKYIEHEGNMFLDEQRVYNEKKSVWDIRLDNLENDIKTYMDMDATKRNSNSIKTSFFGLLDKSVCENPMLKDEKDKLILKDFPAVPLFIEFFCRKKREGRPMVNTWNVPRQDIAKKTVPMRGEKDDDSESE